MRLLFPYELIEEIGRATRAWGPTTDPRTMAPNDRSRHTAPVERHGPVRGLPAALPGPRGGGAHLRRGRRGPVWSRAGREPFFSRGRKLYAVEVQISPELRAGTPVLLFESEARTSLAGAFDVSADGQRFVATVSSQHADEALVARVVTNWFEEVRRLSPTEPSR